jgi:hypothetical protein
LFIINSFQPNQSIENLPSDFRNQIRQRRLFIITAEKMNAQPQWLAIPSEFLRINLISGIPEGSSLFSA